MDDVQLNSILIVEDNPGLRKQLQWSFSGYKVHLASDRVGAVKAVKQYKPKVVTLDLGLPPDQANASEGLAALAEILQEAPFTKIIVVTGNEDRENALKAVELGAYDFYQKPVDPDILSLIIDRAFKLCDLEEENHQLREQTSNSDLDGIIGSSLDMQAVKRMVEKVAPSDVTALLLGESGTGKELFARALHSLSSRREQPFIAVNCAAIPGDLLESELFGYEKGAFTGAVKQTQGKLEYANGGTLFLDEIGDMPPGLQVKMLRFLQERVIERIGGRNTIPVDVRIVCATHQDLDVLMNGGVFRADLYYRISEIVINIPPLRDRGGDQILLAERLLSKYNQESGRDIRGFTEEALAQIIEHSWPGNVRELENSIKRAVVLAEGRKITVEDLGFADTSIQPEALNLRLARERVEREVIERALSIHKYNISHSAEALGVSRPSLYSLMKKLDIAENGK